VGFGSVRRLSFFLAFWLSGFPTAPRVPGAGTYSSASGDEHAGQFRVGETQQEFSIGEKGIDAEEFIDDPASGPRRHQSGDGGT